MQNICKIFYPCKRNLHARQPSESEQFCLCCLTRVKAVSFFFFFFKYNFWPDLSGSKESVGGQDIQEPIDWQLGHGG